MSSSGDMPITMTVNAPLGLVIDGTEIGILNFDLVPF